MTTTNLQDAHRLLTANDLHHHHALADGGSLYHCHAERDGEPDEHAGMPTHSHANHYTACRCLGRQADEADPDPIAVHQIDGFAGDGIRGDYMIDPDDDGLRHHSRRYR